MRVKLILSCEHGGNQIPTKYSYLFKGKKALLQSHRGWDIGALDLFNQFKRYQEVSFAIYSNISRLLIEINRSQHHPKLFSEITSNLSIAEKEEIIEQYYLNYRNQVERAIAEEIRQGNSVIHLSVHSFTPIFNGVARNAEIGLLYDPRSEWEKQICSQWKHLLQKQLPTEIRLRSNYPYRGNADGFTTYLRKKFSKQYAGIELEVNNNLLQSEGREEIREILIKTFYLSTKIDP